MAAADGEQKSTVVLPIAIERLEAAINDTLGTSGKIAKTDCEIIAEGRGFLSYITKVKLTWSKVTDQKLPRSVIVKKPTLERVKDLKSAAELFKGRRESLASIHNRECDAYSLFAARPPAPFPMAQAFLLEKMTMNPDTGLLVLSDLSEVARSLDFSADATLEQVLAIAEYIGCIQAHGFNHPEYKEVIGAMPMNMLEHISKTDGLADAAVVRENYAEKFTITDEQITKIQKEVAETMDLMLNPETHGYTTVLCLTDLQPNNVLWKTNPDGSLSNEVAAFVDFQFCCQGHCTVDLGAFMTLNLPSDMRKANEDKILGHYLDTLISKCHKDPGITMTEVRELFAIQTKFYAFASLGFARSMVQLGPQMGISKEREFEIIERLMAGFGVC